MPCLRRPRWHVAALSLHYCMARDHSAASLRTMLLQGPYCPLLEGSALLPLRRITPPGTTPSPALLTAAPAGVSHQPGSAGAEPSHDSGIGAELVVKTHDTGPLARALLRAPVACNIIVLPSPPQSRTPASCTLGTQTRGGGLPPLCILSRRRAPDKRLAELSGYPRLLSRDTPGSVQPLPTAACWAIGGVDGRRPLTAAAIPLDSLGCVAASRCLGSSLLIGGCGPLRQAFGSASTAPCG